MITDFSYPPRAMIFHFQPVILCVVVSAFWAAVSSAGNISSPECTQSCGGNRVSYPFGFSDGCAIKLNCSSSGAIQIGDFPVQNVTSDQILIGVPANCDRSTKKLAALFRGNFAPTSRNGLLLEHCKSPLKDCVVPNKLAASGLNFEACNSTARNSDFHNIACYPSQGLNNGSEFLNYEEMIRKGNCGVFFSSIMVYSNDNSSTVRESTSIWLELQTMELGWWINGACDCDPNANCMQVSYDQGKQGFRCKCTEGYAGDGFTNGDGCRRVSNCNAPWYNPAECNGTRTGILIGGAIAGASTIVLLVVLCYYIRRRSKSVTIRLSSKHLLSEAASDSQVPIYHYKEVERATNGFCEERKLGTGAYGTVYSGKLHNGEMVAIKKIKYRDHETTDQVMNEIKLLSSVSHPNLVRLLGCSIEKGQQILVYEYMPNGTLSQHLRRERGSVLPWTVRLTIAAETARAISHLHSGINPPIYHRDIKSSNILLDLNFNAKVADFGLSRFGMMDDSHISTVPQGTPGYVDPQYHQSFYLSDKSDVYSFGVVLVEIISGMKAVDFSRPPSEINLAALAIDKIRKGLVDDLIDPFLEPNRDAWTLSSMHGVAELAFRCLAFHRDMRPSMMEVADELDQIRLSGWAPSQENVHVGSSAASSCSSTELGSEKVLNTLTSKLDEVENRRLVVLKIEEVKDNGSPVSVQDSWLSEQSSLSTNSLLGKVVG